jgi:hypothetical protein
MTYHPHQKKFVAAIVKGLVEAGDPYRHFGSLAGFHVFAKLAQEMGLVEIAGPRPQLTEAGRLFYEKNGLSALPNGRATEWQ